MKSSVLLVETVCRLNDKAGATTKPRMAIGIAKQANRESNPVILVNMVAACMQSRVCLGCVLLEAQ